MPKRPINGCHTLTITRRVQAASPAMPQPREPVAARDLAVEVRPVDQAAGPVEAQLADRRKEAGSPILPAFIRS